MNGCFSMPSPALGFSILKDCCQFKRSLLFWFAFLGCLLSLSFMPVFTVGLYLEGNRRISSSSSVCDISVLAPLFWHQKPSPKENRWSLCFFLGQDPMSAVHRGRWHLYGLPKVCQTTGLTSAFYIPLSPRTGLRVPKVWARTGPHSDVAQLSWSPVWSRKTWVCNLVHLGSASPRLSFLTSKWGDNE